MSEESIRSSFPRHWRWLSMWKVLHWIGFGAIWCFLLVCVSLGVVVLSSVFLVGMFLTLTAWAVPLSQLAAFQCPRCGRRFFRWGVFFQPRCLHCELPQQQQ